VQKSTASAKECQPKADAKSLHVAAREVALNYLHNMRYTKSLTKNYEFRKLYNKGKTAASKYVAVYCMRNYKDDNMLGITVSTKLGGAVQRNRIRRRLKEIYRLNEHTLHRGHNIVIVARHRSRFAKWSELESSVLYLFNKLKLINNDNDALEKHSI